MAGDLSGIVDLVGGIISLAAAVSFLLVAGLYASQRRDLLRLRAWMESDAGHPSRDLLASEAILDRAETELAAEEAAAGTISPTTARIPGDRPTLSRITLEREALKPHPRWRRFVGRATQTRVLIALGVVAVVLGVVAILASEKLLEFGGDDSAASTGPPEAGEIEVAVLNGTSTSGAAGGVSDQVVRKGFDVGIIDVAPETPVEQTQAVFTGDSRPEAQRVARALDIDPATVEEADEVVGRRGRGADVIVLVGEDRAGP